MAGSASSSKSASVVLPLFPFPAIAVSNFENQRGEAAPRAGGAGWRRGGRGPGARAPAARTARHIVAAVRGAESLRTTADADEDATYRHCASSL